MRKSFIIGAFFIAGLLFLIFYSSRDASHLHFTLDKFKQQLETEPKKLEDQYMTIYGFVKEGSIQKSGIQANFILESGNVKLPIYFTGKTLLPDTFKDGSEASVDGVYDAEKNQFIADKVLAKCSSKYQEKAYKKQ